MWRGQLMLTTPLLFALGFLTMFLIGGINGAFSAVGAGRLRAPRHVLGGRPPALRPVRRLGVRGHGRVLLLVPEDDRPDAERDRSARSSSSLMFIGFNLTFFPMHELGLAGHAAADRRLLVDAGWNDLNLARHDRRVHDRREHGACSCGTSSSSLRSGELAGDDPWEGNTLEWATTSPPPAYNFDHLPEIRSERPVFDAPPRPDGGALSGRRPMTDRRPTPLPGRAQPAARRCRTTRTAASATRSSGCSCSSPPR